jgi:hypothetical protein
MARSARAARAPAASAVRQASIAGCAADSRRVAVRMRRECGPCGMSTRASCGWPTAPRRSDSELLGQVLGDRGLHARSAVGVTVLPVDAPVALEIQVELSD